MGRLELKSIRSFENFHLFINREGEIQVNNIEPLMIAGRLFLYLHTTL